MKKTCSSCGRPLKDGFFHGGKVVNNACRSPVCPKYGKPQ